MFLGLWHKAPTLVSFQAENYPNTEADAAEEMGSALGVRWRRTEKKGSKELWQRPVGCQSRAVTGSPQGTLSQMWRGFREGERTCPVSVTVDWSTEATATQPRDPRFPLEAGAPTLS